MDPIAPWGSLAWYELIAALPDRLRRLFACACCRSIWHRLTAEGRHAVEVAERYADGLATLEELEAAGAAVRPTPPTGLHAFAGLAAEWTTGSAADQTEAIGAAVTAIAEEALEASDAAGITRGQVNWAAIGEAEAAEHRKQERFLADIVRVPVAAFQPSGEALQVATTIYHEGRFDELPILADALVEQGLAEGSAIILHLRSGGPHVKGCWALDLLLGKK